MLQKMVRRLENHRNLEWCKRKKCRSRQDSQKLSDEFLLAKIGFDTAAERSKKCMLYKDPVGASCGAVREPLQSWVGKVRLPSSAHDHVMKNMYSQRHRFLGDSVWNFARLLCETSRERFKILRNSVLNLSI